MEWLNYHHLLYFWTVARLGSIAKASKELLLAPPTISAQIRRLEESLGEKLLQKSGRGLALTEMGHVVYRYAEEIFSLGRELTDTMRGRPTGHPLRLRIGVADVLPKRIAYHLIKPALGLPGGVRVMCREERPARLLAALAVHELDVVLSDAPVGPEVSVRAFSHPLFSVDLQMGTNLTPEVIVFVVWHDGRSARSHTGRRRRPMARTICFRRDSSNVSCLRPAGGSR